MEIKKIIKIEENKYRVLRKSKYSNDWNKVGKKYTTKGLETLINNTKFNYIMEDETDVDIKKYQAIKKTKKQEYDR